MNAAQRGFGAIVALVILVIMAVLAAGLVRLGTTQQATSTQDILSARALQVARAGNEWGLYQALQSGNCSGASGTLDLRAATGFSVTVNCTSQVFNEGETINPSPPPPLSPLHITVYSIAAVACNSAVCPDAALAATPGYIERKRLVIANTP
ncbi:MAG TPA: MSHA biogenesis protein MshP [Burkholderiales bacterium]|nr:MSHA biogenesis protein MshP [Burkholderiales bacterium]